MVTIDQIDTPNSNSKLARKACNRRLDSGQRVNLERDGIHSDSNPDQSNQEQPRQRSSCPANWLSRAWRMLTNSSDKNEG
jgi:hypothetical protein